jgi:hypothetical protein
LVCGLFIDQLSFLTNNRPLEPGLSEAVKVVDHCAPYFQREVKELLDIKGIYEAKLRPRSKKLLVAEGEEQEIPEKVSKAHDYIFSALTILLPDSQETFNRSSSHRTRRPLPPRNRENVWCQVG